MTGRTRPNRSRSLQPVERQLSSISNTTTDEYDLLADDGLQDALLPSRHSTLDDSDESSVASDTDTHDPSLELSDNPDVDPDALLQLMSDQGTPTLHAIGTHFPMLDDESESEASDSSSLLLPDSVTLTSTSKATSLSPAPTIIRVLYMGSASENDKSNILRKLSEGLAEIFLQRPPDAKYDLKTQDDVSATDQRVFSGSTLHTDPSLFKERKHNVLPLSTTARFAADDDNDSVDEPIETYEDNGLAIIEADFTRSSEREFKNASTDTIYDYVIQHMDTEQLHDSTETSSQRRSHRFEGYIYPDPTPDGVDLIVYFYSGLENDEERQNEIEDDMILLWKLRQLGIPVLPILSSLITTKRRKPVGGDISIHRDEPNHDTPISVSSGSTGGSSRRRTSPIRTNGRHHRWHDSHHSNADYNQVMMENRTYLSNMFAEYRIQCLDVLNLEIGRPSFHRRQRGSPDNTHKEDWETSSLMPAPWQILTVEQFASVDKKAVYEALKKSREMAVKRETVRDIIRAKRKSMETTSPSDSKASLHLSSMKINLIRWIMGIFIPFVVVFCLFQGSTTSTLHLSNSTTTVGPPAMAKLHPMWSTLEANSKTHLFVVEVFDKFGRPSSFGPSGVKLKTVGLTQGRPEHILDMAELGQGQYMLEVLSPCFQEDPSSPLQVEIETVLGIPVQDSPVTLTACPTSTNRVSSGLKSRPTPPPPRSPPQPAPPVTLHRTLKKPWYTGDRLLRKAKAFGRASVAVRMITQACDFVYYVIGIFWDEAGFRDLLHRLPASHT
ncbi:hypothetical protein K450DRAFT_238499 [Umbelopsis ramanniana AG]|uniref:Uncharacterized protein n=1 Tax=Umbelopsis ramanniana AG TaxID=1314678 RepID=A0AAD5HDH3_UMBRA|nr:uncharacterized protein K450DRAFT_238499 [Umbelopsis ramanniana AG]KAI8580172.1 hypothetical protein K450DRAFT_238499 [Umbelopsis ramanniana AG]